MVVVNTPSPSSSVIARPALQAHNGPVKCTVVKLVTAPLQFISTLNIVGVGGGGEGGGGEGGGGEGGGKGGGGGENAKS